MLSSFLILALNKQPSLPAAAETKFSEELLSGNLLLSPGLADVLPQANDMCGQSYS